MVASSWLLHQFYWSEAQQQSLALSLQDRKEAGGSRRKETKMQAFLEAPERMRGSRHPFCIQK